MTSSLAKARLSLFVLTCLLAVPHRISAQVLYGSIVGTVQDPSGANVPGAAIVIAEKATGQSMAAISRSDGTYLFAEVPAGTYTLTIEAKGFRTSKTANVVVSINAVTRQDVALQVGEQTQTVMVEATASTLQTDTADVHTSLGTQQVTNLPLPGYRNYQTLINLVPGAAPAAYQNAVSASPGRSLQTNINGTTSAANNTRLDGALDMRPSLPGQTLYVPPAESIETVNISTNSFDAEQGFAGGAAISVITKSGTNQFHAVLFEHHTDSDLTDRNFFNLSTPRDILNNYGGTVGGPIKKNKLFFFAGWEGMREHSTYTSTLTVPTDPQRAGNFAGFSTIYDPSTGAASGTGRTPFPNNMIPTNRLSSNILTLQALIPEPNLGGTTSNYFAQGADTFDRDNVDAKLNWNVSDKTLLWTKYSAMKALVTDPFSLGQAGGSGLINGGGAGTGNVLQQIAAFGGEHTFSPTFLVDGTVAVSRDPVTLIGPTPSSGEAFGLNVLGIPGTNGPNSYYDGIPEFSISGYSTLGNSEIYTPKIYRDTSFLYSLNASKVKGAHDIRFGLDVARFRVNEFCNQSGGGGAGTFTFNGGVTLPGAGSPSQYNTYAAFLLGLPQTDAHSLEPYWQTPRALMDGLYFRDRWQVSRNLTLTLGVRWEYYPIMTFADFGVLRFDPTSGNVNIGGLGSVPYNAGVTTSKKQFVPRVGVAYRIGGTTVIRAGFGMSVLPTVETAPEASYPITVQQSWAGNTTYIPYGPIASGIPTVTLPNVSAGIVPLPTVTSTTSLPLGLYKRGYIESYNFTTERELPGGILASVGYVGTHTIRLPTGFNINAANPGGGNSGRPLAAEGYLVNESLTEPIGGALYNSLQASANRKLTNGMQVGVAYTFSKSLDNFSTCYTCTGSLMWYDAADYHRNWAVSDFNRSQNFRVSWVAELPFGPGKRWAQNGIEGQLLGGWQVNGIFTAYSGLPFTVSASSTSLNAPGQSQTANQIKPTVAKLGGIGANSPYFDPTAFAPVTAAAVFGNAGRNILFGPGLVNADASLFRNFRVKERWAIQLRGEAYNISNTPHFNNPAANVSSGGFLTITSALSRLNNVEGGERQFRVAMRVSF